MRNLLAISLLILVSLPLHAEVGPVVFFNIEGGGDTIPTDAGAITAGGGIHLAAGIQIDIDNTLSGHITYGYKSNTVSREDLYIDEEASFSRWPLEVMGFFKIHDVRIGGGVTFQYGPKETCFVFSICGYVINYKDAEGLVFQVDKVWRVADANPNSFVRDFSIGFRATFIEYETEDGLDVFNGNSVGLSMGVVF